MDPFQLHSYHYSLPPELIAQHPLPARDQSRLLLVDKKAGTFSEMKVADLKDLLQAGDSLVFNDTRVIPARLMGTRSRGGRAEIFLLKRLSSDTWEVLARPGKKLRLGTQVMIGEDFSAEVIENLPDGHKIVRLSWQGLFEEKLAFYGQMPLPHYIQRSHLSPEDKERYQTVFASQPGAVAAPTAGLHFTKALLKELQEKKVEQYYLTLHVGLGTFQPVKEEDIRSHVMHQESFIIQEATAQQLNAGQRGKKRICVGTTSCRALETASSPEGLVKAGHYETALFIYPGYQFKHVQALLTNFHLPGSSLLMLVCAFAGYELVMEAYQKAIKDRFRFYSYGDAMLII